MDSRARVGEAIVGQSVVGYVVQTESSANVSVVGNVDLTYHILVYVSSLFSVVGQAVVDAVYTKNYISVAPNKLNVNTLIVFPKLGAIANPNTQNVATSVKQPLSVTQIWNVYPKSQNVVINAKQPLSITQIWNVCPNKLNVNTFIIPPQFNVIANPNSQNVVINAKQPLSITQIWNVCPNKLNVNTFIIPPQFNVIANPNSQNVVINAKQPLSVTQIWSVYPMTFSLDMSLGASQFIYAISPLISHMSTYTKFNYARYAKLLFFKNSKLTHGVDRNAF